MEKWVMVVVFMLLGLSSFQAATNLSNSTGLSIDCGATVQRNENCTRMTWQLDDKFVQGGKNQYLIDTDSTLLPWKMNTLRSFPEGRKNCYNLPLYAQAKYLIRAGFYYGNYDNLQNPPTFDLEFDGNHWATINTSFSDIEPIYYEMIYITQREVITVCLIRTQEDQIPFISTLEAIYLYSMYTIMDNDTMMDKALYLERRINFGANQNYTDHFCYVAEEYNRYWKPQQINPTYRNLYWGFDPNNTASLVENSPPYSVLAYAIEAQNVSESIFLPISFHQQETQLSAYFVFYFAESNDKKPPNSTRKLAVYIDGEEKNVTAVGPDLDEFVVVSVYPVNVTAGMANVTISPAEGTTLPPIISAMEVYSAIKTVDTVPGSNGSNNCLFNLFSPWSLLLALIGLIYSGFLPLFS